MEGPCLRLLALALLGILLASCASTPPVPAAPVVDPRVPLWTVDEARYAAMPAGEGSIAISLGEQTLRLLDGSQYPVIVTDCSTGKLEKPTPRGRFRILEKIVDKRSNKYGSYVDAQSGAVVAARSWEVAKPPGTQFLGAAMPYWMRLTWTGVGIHVGGFQRGQPSSMGCIRLPAEVQPLIYAKSIVGMPVMIE